MIYSPFYIPYNKRLYNTKNAYSHQVPRNMHSYERIHSIPNNGLKINTNSTNKLDLSKNQTKENNNYNNNKYNTMLFNFFGLKLYFDDILLICLIFFLYNEGTKDDDLLIVLILLLLS